ncbi:MAG: hypothetical protein ABW277_09460 [Longimicrobiaceae bacterium]
MTHTVISVDGSRYLRWQADLLAFSHHRAGQPGPLTRLWSAREPPPAFAGCTFRAEPGSAPRAGADDYPPLNRPRALHAWLKAAPPAEEAVLILDPDCVFLAPLAEPASRGDPVAQPIGYLDPERHPELVRRHCRRPGAVQGMGIPVLIHRDDLAALLPPWLEKTEAIRGDARSRALAGWVAEMWGYALAAAEAGMRHTLRETARFSTEDRADLPIVHYCYACADPSGRWRWDKRSHLPWACVAEPPAGTPRAAVALICLLNEWVAEEGHRIPPGAAPRWRRHH